MSYSIVTFNDMFISYFFFRPGACITCFTILGSEIIVANYTTGGFVSSGRTDLYILQCFVMQFFFGSEHGLRCCQWKLG